MTFSHSVSHQEPVTSGTTLCNGVQIETLLGRGGMAEVWRAATVAGSTVALKIPRADPRVRSVANQLIRREFSILERLSHTHVLKSLGLIAVEDRPCLITEYLGGGDLVSLLGARPRYWVRAARDVALALAYVHESGKVHRDVKPRNVLFSATDGGARLVDFALAADIGGKASRGGGTAAYARVAQRQGAVSEVADDVHAFAVLLYELLAGRLPFGANPPLELLQIEPSPPVMTSDRVDSGSLALAELVQETLSPGRKSAPGSVRPFLDVLESMLLEYE